MPTYQYTCTDCGEPLEAVQSFSDPALTACPACGGTLRKVFSAVGVVFKGSGFYKTDSRSGGKTSGEGGGGKAPAEGGGGGAAKDGASSGGKESAASSGGKDSSRSTAASTSSSTSTPAAKSA